MWLGRSNVQFSFYRYLLLKLQAYLAIKLSLPFEVDLKIRRFICVHIKV